ncbi:hypothetical protein ATCC90586_004649 [Pythium insidiosum]|nr:hypothetical protein ATCC90586_004649 [Pythium insidiosum]
MMPWGQSARYVIQPQSSSAKRLAVAVKPAHRASTRAAPAPPSPAPDAAPNARKYVAGKWDMWALGLTIVIGGQYFSWNAGLEAGDNGGIEVSTFGAIIALLTAFYFGYARKRQTFSEQENRVLLVAHVMRFNSRRSKGNRKSVSRTIATNATTASHAPASNAPVSRRSQRSIGRIAAGT